MVDELTFKCPSCGTKLRAVRAMDVATQVVKRTCRKSDCRETWQLVVQPLIAREGVRIDKASFTFLGRVSIGNAVEVK